MATTISSSTTTGTAATAAATSTGTSSATATSKEVTTANKSAAQKLISSLNAGSGVDVATLAQNLVDAERIPQENAINAKITKDQSRISGYSAVSYVMSQVNTALASLKDQKSFNVATVQTSSSAFTATTSAGAVLGTHDVDILSLAKPQRTVSSTFTSPTQKLNGGQAITFSLAVGTGGSITTSDIVLADGSDTPQGLVDAINGAKKGVTAQLSQTGDPSNPYKIVLIGTMGATNAFSLTPKFSMGGVGAGTDSMNGGTPIDVKVTLPANTSIALGVTTTQGSGTAGSTQTESSVVQFPSLVAGGTVNVGGKILTTTSAMTAAEVATAFKDGTLPAGAAFSGSLSGFTATAINGSQVTFTSSTSNTNVNDLTASYTSPSAVTKIITVADTPNAMVAGINSALADNGNSLGLSAQLVANPAGSQFANKVFISGANGLKVEANYGGGYQTLTNPTAFSFANNQSATDASIKVDGVTYTRSSNTLSDVLTGVTFNLKNVTTTTDGNGNVVNNTATMDLTRDPASIKTNIQTLVTAYNDAMTIFGEVTNPKSTLDTYGATLVGDSTVRMLKQQLRDMLTGTSSTPGTSVSAFWQMGITIDQKGVMSVDNTQLDTALNTKFDDVVTAFTGNQNYLLSYSTQKGGIAGDAYKKITTILSNTGVIAAHTNNAQTEITKYQAQLTKLQTRMDALLTRYQKQLTTMDSLVGSVKGQQTSLKSAFDGMMAMYTNK